MELGTVFWGQEPLLYSPAGFMRVMVHLLFLLLLLLNLVIDTLLFLWHLFCGFLLILLSLSWLGQIVCWQVSTIYPFCSLPDTMVSWKVCMLVFPPHCVSRPTPPNVRFRYPEAHYNWSIKVFFWFVFVCFCLFVFSLITKFYFYLSQLLPPNSKTPHTGTAVIYPLLSPRAVSVLGKSLVWKCLCPDRYSLTYLVTS